VPQGPTGAQGPLGLTGPQGEPGAPATSDWAIVCADGTLRASCGVDPSGSGGGAGTYEVDFAPRDVSDCAAVATAREEPGTLIVPTFAAISRLSPVHTFNRDGTLVASGFELAVFC
jgi:hypothetical protein